MNLKEIWGKYNKRVIGTPGYWHLTASHYSLFSKLLPIIKEHASGKILDVGAGEMTFSYLLKPLSKSYITLDRFLTHSDLDMLADVDHLPFKNGSFDTVFCSQVLEHIPHPWIALHELGRVLKSGGKLIISVPHLSYLHGEPSDYFRFTGHGIALLTEVIDCTCREIIPAGGLVSFVLTIPSILALSLTSSITWLNTFLRWLNRYYVLAVFFLDKFLDRKKLYALNFVVLIRKK